MRKTKDASVESLVEALRGWPHRFPPTVRQLSEVLSMSKSRVQQVVDLAVERGLVRRVPGMARTLEVV